MSVRSNVAVVLALVLLPAPATAAVWPMNERPAARIMHDTTGTVDGRIGARVQPGHRSYRFPGLARRITRRNIVTVPHHPTLNPGRAAFTVTIRFRMRHQFPGPNLIQKGQSGTPGGYWKVEVHRDRPTCHYRDTHGVTSAVRGPFVADNRWHTVRCTRTAAGTTAIGVRTGSRWWRASNPRVTGLISNDWPLAIGGKARCRSIDKPPAKACDYFAGRIGKVAVR